MIQNVFFTLNEQDLKLLVQNYTPDLFIVIEQGLKLENYANICIESMNMMELLLP